MTETRILGIAVFIVAKVDSEGAFLRSSREGHAPSSTRQLEEHSQLHSIEHAMKIIPSLCCRLTVELQIGIIKVARGLCVPLQERFN